MNKIKYLLLLFIISLPLSGFGLPKITKINVTQGTCLANGEMEVIVENATPPVKYAIIAPAELATPIQTNNVFTGLPKATYTVAVYDETTQGTPVTQTVFVNTDYPELALNAPTASVLSDRCPDNGRLYVSYTGGRAPYLVTITNTSVTPAKEYTQTTSNTSLYFNNLPKGNYHVSVKDNCEETRFTVNTTAVNSTGGLQDVSFTTFAVNGTPSVSGAGSCTNIYVQVSYSNMYINGSNSISNAYYPAIKYRVEYPAGTNNYTAWTTANSTAYMQITNYDPTKLNYRIQVQHPCSQEILTDPTTYQLPAVTENYTISNHRVMEYNGFCDIPDKAAAYIQKTTTGISGYVCGEYPYTVTCTPTSGKGTETKTYTWISGNTFWLTNLDVATTYEVKITDKNGVLLKTLTATTTNPTKPMTVALTSTQLLNYRCDGFSTIALSFYATHPITYYGSYIMNGTITFSIESGPAGVSRSPIVKNLDQSYTVYLWDDLPYGAYKIKAVFSCGREEILNLSLNQSYSGFSGVVLNAKPGAVCGKYDLTATSQYLNMNNQPVNVSTYMYLYKKDPQGGNPTLISSVRTSSYTFTNLSGGDYYVEAKPYYFNNTPFGENCILGTTEMTLLPYSPPKVNVPLSGGITCSGESTARLTITAEGGNPPYKYRVKEKGQDDSYYTPLQDANVFDGVPPGKYIAQVQDNCSETTQEVTVFYGKDQFLIIEEEVEPGVVCSGRPTVFTVLSVGPVESYKWYRNTGNGYELIPNASGHQYVIDHTTTQDFGFYKVVIYNGYCELDSEVELKGIVDAPGKPTLTGECVINEGTDLKVSVSGSDIVTYIWYKDGAEIVGEVQSTYKATEIGTYTVKVKSLGGCISEESNAISVSAPVMYWSKTPADNNWNNPVNWVDEHGNALNCVPSGCSDVHIPGNATTYPDLSETYTPRDQYGDPNCNQIWFHFGGEVAQSDLLNYTKAYIRYNFGKNDGVNDVYTNEDIYSAEPMKRNRWYALAAPLQKMASGDFSVGGYPNIWRQGFRTTSPQYGKLEGDWYSPVADNGLELGEKQHYAVSVWAAKLQNEIGESDHTNLNQLGGYLEMPYFENTEISKWHRIHSYIAGVSKFRYYNNTVPSLDLYEEWQQMPGRITRRNEAYRFITDKKMVNYGNDRVFSLSVPAGDEIMVGNPFLSSLDFNIFYEMNKEVVEDYYRLYEHPWNTYGTPSTELIPSFQAFFIKTKGVKGSTVTLRFPASASVARSGDYTLKSARMTENVLYPEVTGKEGKSKAVISFNEYLYTQSVPQLFISESDPVSGAVPQFFVLGSDGFRNVIHSEKATASDVELRLGVQSSSADEMELRFANVESMEVTSLSLVDEYAGTEIDLLRNNVYQFTNVPEFSERFRLVAKGLRSVTGIEDVIGSEDNVKIYTHGKMLYVSSDKKISQVLVNTLQGTLISHDTHIEDVAFSKELQTSSGVYIVTVKFVDNSEKNEKIIINK